MKKIVCLILFLTILTTSFAGCGGNTGMRGGFKPCTLEETDTYIISRDSMGRTVKLVKGFATIPLPMAYPVTDMDSWLKLKPFYTFHEDRINWDWVEKAKKMQAEGTLPSLTM